jgi:2,3-dihydroxybenzoate-AMP ligase
MLTGVVPWPDDIAQTYRERGWWKGITLGAAFEASVAAHGDRVAVVDGDRRVTYFELAHLVDRLALHLAGRGIGEGERAIFQLPNVLEFVVAYLACLKTGAIPVMCLPTCRHAEIAHLARFTEARAWFLAADHAGFDGVRLAAALRPEIPTVTECFVLGDRAGDGMTRLAELLAAAIEEEVAVDALERIAPSPGDVAVFQLSGGSTGLPRVIPRTHDDYLYNSLGFAEVAAFDRDTVLLVGMPAAHHVPLACPGIQAALLRGARVVLAPSPDAEVVFPLIERERVTWIPAAPATAIAWLGHPARARHDLSSIRTLAVGQAKLDAAPARALRRVFGPVVMQVFTMAEGLLCATRPDDPEEVVVETQGRPMSPDDEIRIVDEAGADVAPGEAGELQGRGPSTIHGYYNAPEWNRVAFADGGFLRTGDIVRRHPSGNLVVEGRKQRLVDRAEAHR